MGEFAIFEINNNFVVFKPSIGKGVYTQKQPEYDLKKLFYTG